jgi:HEPN domain-containing protein
LITIENLLIILFVNSYHHTLKDVLQKNKRLTEVIRRLVNLASLRLTDRQMKQHIREVRFNTKEKDPLLVNFSKSITPYAWKLIEHQMKFVKNTVYDFKLDEVSQLWIATLENY